VAGFPIVDALGDLDAVDLAVVYGVPAAAAGRSLAVAALTLRPGFELEAKAIAGALANLPAAERPDLVHVVDEIPVTTWYRPSTGALRAAGAPSGDRVWRRDGDAYVAAAPLAA
jgi:putative long chain acyl-CoA synthase